MQSTYGSLANLGSRKVGDVPSALIGSNGQAPRTTGRPSLWSRTIVARPQGLHYRRSCATAVSNRHGQTTSGQKGSDLRRTLSWAAMDVVYVSGLFALRVIDVWWFNTPEAHFGAFSAIFLILSNSSTP